MLIHLPREDGYGTIPRTKNGPAARRLRRDHDEERVGVDDDDPARAAAPVADLGPRQRTLRSTPRSRSRPASRSTSPTRTAPGSAARTRTPTGCSASTSPKEPTSLAGAPRRSKPSPRLSTTDPARHSAGGPQRKHSMSIYSRVNKPVLLFHRLNPPPPAPPPDGTPRRPRPSSTPSQCGPRTYVPKASRGWDNAKKVNGRKRHIAVGTAGLLLAVVVTAGSTSGPRRLQAVSVEPAARVPRREAHLGRRRLRRQTHHLGCDRPADDPGNRHGSPMIHAQAIARTPARGGPALPVGTARPARPADHAAPGSAGIHRNIRATMPCPASAPKPGKPGPGRPPGSKNRRPAARHDVGKAHQKGTHTQGTARTNRLNDKLSDLAGIAFSGVGFRGRRGPDGLQSGRRARTTGRPMRCPVMGCPV